MPDGDSRILTTHAGSLPRPPALAELHGQRSRGEPGLADVAPSLVWEKLRALRAGADLASARLL